MEIIEEDKCYKNAVTKKCATQYSTILTKWYLNIYMYLCNGILQQLINRYKMYWISSKARLTVLLMRTRTDSASLCTSRITEFPGSTTDIDLRKAHRRECRDKCIESLESKWRKLSSSLLKAIKKVHVLQIFLVTTCDGKIYSPHKAHFSMIESFHLYGYWILKCIPQFFLPFVLLTNFHIIIFTSLLFFSSFSNCNFDSDASSLCFKFYVLVTFMKCMCFLLCTILFGLRFSFSNTRNRCQVLLLLSYALVVLIDPNHTFYLAMFI